MIRRLTRIARATKRFVRELYHDLRVCPACRSGRVWIPNIGGRGCHVSPANRRVADPRRSRPAAH